MLLPVYPKVIQGNTIALYKVFNVFPLVRRIKAVDTTKQL